MKIAIIEPYYGGSHKAFLDYLARHLSFDFSFHTLPARKWKWRMRLSAPYFAEKFQVSANKYTNLSAILASPFLDVATFKGMLPQKMQHIPVITYFHENQFAYPVQVHDERDFHFSLTNLTTAIASDRLAFNSRYNLESFLTGAAKVLKLSYDMKLEDFSGVISSKSTILYPAIDFDDIDSVPRKEEAKVPVILWNHRWEHDKNPEMFFKTLYSLARKGKKFKLIVLGESFKRSPAIFREAKDKLKDYVVHFGYAKSRTSYVKLLKKADIVVSTSNHEFYGISVIEAVRAGCRPLLPNRLSYPELFPDTYLYKDEDFEGSLSLLLDDYHFSSSLGRTLTEQFSWKHLQDKYVRWLSNDCF